MHATSRLPSECVEALRAGAIIGESFDVDVLAATLKRPVLDCIDALGSAVDENIVEPLDGPERYRFVTSDQHRGVLEGIAASDKVRLHARVAESIGSLHGEAIDSHLFELAAHWSAAAVGDYRAPAAEWIARAASAATEVGSHAQAARLYRRAIAIGSGSADVKQLAERQLGLAVACYRTGDVAAAVAAANEAALSAARANLAELVAEAALVVEPSVVPGVNEQVRQLCAAGLEALDRAGPADQVRSLRVRVLARLADVCHYLGDHAGADEVTIALNVQVPQCKDLRAVATVLHAQQLAASGADGVARREALAAQLAGLARALDDPTEKVWSHLWRIDAALQRGDISAAAREVRLAAGAVERTGDVRVRWELLRAQAALAQAQARFDDAIALADEAEAIMTAIGNPIGRFIWMGQRQNIYHHNGLADDVLDARAAAGGSPSDAPLIVTLTAAELRSSLGDRVGAAAAYRSLGPPDSWTPALHSDLFAWAYGIKVAISLAEGDDVRTLRKRLERHRGLHVATGAGAMAYFGPVELWLGIAAAHLGEHDTAVTELEIALRACVSNGATGFRTEAEVHLASALLARAAPGDALRARQLAEAAAERAELLGMTPMVAAARRVVERTLPARSGELTRREREVAALVAKGLSNRAIARQLQLSERTAANHVQHILDKLGMDNRTQVSVWLSSEETSTA